MDHARGRKWTKQEILEALRAFNEKHGRPPVSRDQMQPENGLPRPMTIRNNFGTWDNALKEAGLTTWSERGGRPTVTWTEETAIAAIRGYVAKYGSPPPAKSSNRRELGIPSQSALARLFGSYSEAIRRAGFTPRKVGAQPGEYREGREIWTREAAIAAIQAYVAKHGSPPTSNLGTVEGLPGKAAIRRLFGKHSEAVRAAGFTPRQRGSQPGRAYRLGTGNFKGKKTPRNEFVGWAFDDRKGEHAELIEKQRRKKDGDSD